MNRRGLLAFLLASPLAPLLKHLRPPEVMPRSEAERILKEVYSSGIRDLVYRKNDFLVSVKAELDRRAALSPIDRDHEDVLRAREAMRERLSWYRAEDSGYAAWKYA